MYASNHLTFIILLSNERFVLCSSGSCRIGNRYWWHRCAERITRVIVSHSDFPVVRCVFWWCIGTTAPLWQSRQIASDGLTNPIKVTCSCCPEAVVICVDRCHARSWVLEHHVHWVNPWVVARCKRNLKCYCISCSYIGHQGMSQS